MSKLTVAVIKEFEFTKMQSLGNDFVILDGIKHPFDLSTEQIQRIANRHFGIGFDQLIVLDLPQSKAVDFSYRIFNANGGEVEQCGNGLRCLVRFINRYYLPNQTVLKLGTKNRIVTAFVEAENVRVDMGRPELTPEKIPFIAEHYASIYEIPIGESLYPVSVISMGNPHAVMKVESVKKLEINKIGHAMSTHSRFPAQTNVEFMEVLSRSHIRLRVYERGVGETLACGSGACAAVVAGHLQGDLDEKVIVELPGGCLQISWVSSEAPVEMIGTGEFVFSGLFNGA